MRTLSKFGLAGVRIGYMMGPAALVAQVDKVRPPYNVSVLNCEAALFALEHEDVFAGRRRTCARARAHPARAARAGPQSRPSDANMILVRVPEPARSFDGMKSRKVLVKNVSRMHPLLANCLRLTVGTADENTQMLAALQASLTDHVPHRRSHTQHGGNADHRQRQPGRHRPKPCSPRASASSTTCWTRSPATG